MKVNRAGVIAGLLVGAVILGACSSSSSKNDKKSGDGACGSGKLNSSGSTAQQNAMNQWIKDYQQKCGSGVTVNYGGGGSGQGVTDFTQGKTDFAGSDSALNPEKGEVAAATKACGSPALDIPMVTGPIAVAYKVNGLTSLTLTPKLLALIFTGKIKTWNDPQIAAANSGAKLPSTKITVFFRSDESGTTANYETYLNSTDPTDYPAKPSKVWVGVGQGKSGSQGVQQAVSTTEGSIGYLEWSFAGSAHLPIAKIDNGGGAVALTAQSAGAAVAAAKVVGTNGDLTLKLDYATTAAGAYPIILVTYEIVCSKYKNASKGTAVKDFLTYTSSQSVQSALPNLGYAPLPSSVLTQVQAAVAKIS